jgi:hypothetical protein
MGYRVMQVMARKPGVEFEGALYHVIVQGNHRRDTFLDQRERMAYLDPIGIQDLRSGFDPTPGCSCALSRLRSVGTTVKCTYEDRAYHNQAGRLRR